MAEQPIKGLIVDFGGVLTTSIWFAFDIFCEREGLEPGTIRELFGGDSEALPLLRRLERGELAEEEFERRFGELLGVEPEGLIERLFSGLSPEGPMIDAVEAARAGGLKTGLISNSWGTGIYDRAPLEIFDAVVISGDVGLHKPEPEIYRMGAARLELDPSECVFVDDLRENVTGAEEVGMTTILHRESTETIAKLEQLLNLSLTS